MAHTFEYVLHFVRCVTVTVSPNQIIIIIIISIIRDRWSMHKDLRRRLIGPSDENFQDPTFVVRRGTNVLYEPKRLEILVKLENVGVD